MKRPKVHAWTIVLFIMGILPLLLLCLWSIWDGWFPTEKVLIKHPDPADTFYVFNKTLAGFTFVISLIATLPIWILVLGKQRPWIWVTTLVFIALYLSSNPIAGIPVLIFWIKDNNKQYYGKA